MYPNVHSKAKVKIEILEDVVRLETHELEDIKCLKICMIDIHKTSTTQNTEKHTIYVQILVYKELGTQDSTKFFCKNLTSKKLKSIWQKRGGRPNIKQGKTKP